MIKWPWKTNEAGRDMALPWDDALTIPVLANLKPDEQAKLVQLADRFLQQKRLDRAQRLLRTTALPVQAVAEAVGYETTSYFYALYKKTFGITPKEYRARLCNNDK